MRRSTPKFHSLDNFFHIEASLEARRASYAENPFSNRMNELLGNFCRIYKYSFAYIGTLCTYVYTRAYVLLLLSAASIGFNIFGFQQAADNRTIDDDYSSSLMNEI